MLRLSPPRSERLLESPQLVASFGGEANVAISLAQLGAQARFITILPEPNPLSEAFLSQLRSFNVDASHIVRAHGRMGLCFIETTADQSSSRILYDREHTALARAKPGSVDWNRALDGVTWFHLTGITPGLSAGAAELVLEALRAARDRAIRISCDLTYRRNLWKWGKAASEVIPEMVKLVNVGIANEEDCQRALNIHVDIEVESRSLEHEKYQELTERVLATYPNLELLAVTLQASKAASPTGSSACLHTGKEFHLSHRPQIARIVDGIRGTDNFAAALIYRLSQLESLAGAPKEALVQALDFAVAASGRVEP